MEEIKKTYHFIEVYLFENKLYVISRVELPPIYVWCAVNPVIEVTDFNSNNLALALESAKKKSKSHLDPSHADPTIKALDARKKEIRQILNQSLKQWSLLWNEEGSIDVRSEIPDKIYRGDMQWKTISKKTFSPPVSSQHIAQEIITQTEAK